MTQCLYLDSQGRRCRNPAEEGTPFCLGHDPESAAGIPREGRGLRRWVFRLVALLLLAIFLIPLVVRGYRLLRALLN